MELVEMLTSALGVKEDVAKGGAGLILGLAKQKLGEGEFAQISKQIPDINSILDAAPGTGGGMLGTLGKMASGLGGTPGQLGTLASLAGGFSKLGLDSGMIGKFIPIILSFVQSRGGEGVRALLEKALK